MNKIKNKLVIGFIFALFASLAQTLFKYHQDYLNQIVVHKNQIAFSFLIFFLIGYMIIGNLSNNKN